MHLAHFARLHWASFAYDLFLDFPLLPFLTHCDPLLLWYAQQSPWMIAAEPDFINQISMDEGHQAPRLAFISASAEPSSIKQ